MGDDLWSNLFASVAIFLVAALFVAGEYALVSCRRPRVEAAAKQKKRAAILTLGVLNDLQSYLAGTQIGITVCGIALGSVVEPFLTASLIRLAGPMIDPRVGTAVSFFLVTFAVVVAGELVPKYIALDKPERITYLLIYPLRAWRFLLQPLIWLTNISAAGFLKLIGIKLDEDPNNALLRDELQLLVRAGSVKGLSDKQHALFVSRAMQLDKLMARDVMIHRVDVRWVSNDLCKEDTLAQIQKIAHTRIPICRSDIDDVVGILYINDFVKLMGSDEFDLEPILRPAVAVPENLTLDRIVQRMREEKSQIVIVVDEYGGTSGLITLEDIVEEIFGDIEDSLEMARPTIEITGRRVSAKADVRYDELLEFIGKELPEEHRKDSLITVMIEKLERMPKLGDVVEIEIGSMRVENMARRRVTRISVQLNEERAEEAPS